ncbi:MAG: LytTR family DNA-binding domain-containing protein [Cytophagales bacterium]|nr:LytTR family DNA-binding domain-containing protein [Cytophagales bacterium]
MWLSKEMYVFNSRVWTHVLFWISYYVLFGIMGTENGDLFRSFEREFVAMPTRIGAGYLTIYFLIPRLLLKERYFLFGSGYLSLLGLVMIGQRLACFYFHECFFMDDEVLMVPALFQRALVDLVIVTLLVSSIKLFKLWRAASPDKEISQESPLLIKAEKRHHRVLPSSILYVEGLGNYVTFYLENNKSLISYLSLKEVEQMLPNTFKRIHKSFIINQDKIDSYSHENVEIAGRIIPIGKAYEL